MHFGIERKVALITGGARGIGFAEAKALCGEGVRLAIVDLDRDAADNAVEELAKEGFEAAAFQADAANEEAVVDVLKAVVAHFGRLDILVNNAGIGVKPAYQVQDMPANAWDQMIHVHMRSTFLWSREAIPHMAKNHFGRIVNTSSMNFTGGGRPGVSHYAAAKAGIAGFTQTLAKEVGPLGITANAIAPGYVATELIAQFDERMRTLLQKQNPMGRLCQPAEVAALVAFLCSAHAGFINGELICLDGGRRDFYWGE
ncbi:SDR family NAD(P)-dependent oxidoreductase [Diaphorobacter caeni]|uniref:SDR family NAD(P)-dependent oxidoreductase n=1 Tax=Diaphorobacter caeni TaxID=2784387 RepID=UPI001890502B|nr:SDR family NAD(P)-dependent oxidoreductase [Diaphorobacter caeni]MBF5007282.1 SDR family oxidoreductase [Diaphorobacter caeni]